MIGSCHFVKCKHDNDGKFGKRCDRMTEKQFTVEDIEDMIYHLGVLISDDSHGLLITTLKKMRPIFFRFFMCCCYWIIHIIFFYIV